MTPTRSRGRRFLRSTLLAVGVPLLCLTCKEMLPIERRAPLAARRAVEARLVLSDQEPAVGKPLVLLVQVVTGADVRPIASFTARVAYDATRLRLDGERPFEDGDTRLLNPVIGEARVAGISAKGFRDGQLVAMRFTVLGAGATSGLRVAFDELHALDREDLSRVVSTGATVNRSLAP